MDARNEDMKMKHRPEPRGLNYVLIATGMLVVSIFMSMVFIQGA